MTPGSQDHARRFSGGGERPSIRPSSLLEDSEEDERTVVDFFAVQRARSSSSYPDAVTTPLAFSGSATRPSAPPPAPPPEEPSFHRATRPSLAPWTDDERPTIVQRPKPIYASILAPAVAERRAAKGSSAWRTAWITMLATVAFAICFVGVTSLMGPPPSSLGFLGPLAQSPLLRNASAAIANVTGSVFSAPAPGSAAPVPSLAAAAVVAPPSAAPAATTAPSSASTATTAPAGPLDPSTAPGDERAAAEALLTSLAAAHPGDESYREAARILREGARH